MGAAKKKGDETEEQAASTEVATVQEAGAVGAVDFGADAGGGFENTTQADYSTCYVSVLQALSKACKGGKDALGSPGMFLFTDTQEVVDGKEGFLFVPSAQIHLYCEWEPNQGPLVARHEVGSKAVEDAMKFSGTRFGKDLKTEKGNPMVETYYLYGQRVSEEGEPLGTCVIGSSSTKIKKHKELLTRTGKLTVQIGDQKMNPPLFANLLRVRTCEEKRGTHESFNLDFRGAADNNLTASLLEPWASAVKTGQWGKPSAAYLAARLTRDMVQEGLIQASGNKGEAEHAFAEEDKDF